MYILIALILTQFISNIAMHFMVFKTYQEEREDHFNELGINISFETWTYW